MQNLFQTPMGGIAATAQSQTSPQDFLSELLGKLSPEQQQAIMLAQAMKRSGDGVSMQTHRAMKEAGVGPYEQQQAPAPAAPVVAPPGGQDDPMTIEWKKRNAARQQQEFEMLRKKLEGR